MQHLCHSPVREDFTSAPMMQRLESQEWHTLSYISILLLELVCYMVYSRHVWF